MAMQRRRRKKNLSTGAWVVIGLAVGVVLPMAIFATVAMYGTKKVTDQMPMA